MTNKFSISNSQFSKALFRNVAVISFILFLAVSCNLFSKPPLAGVAKTINGGVDWTAINMLKDSQQTIAHLNVAKIDFDPRNKETIFVSGFNDGLYKSEDAGGSWQRILSKIWVYDFALHPFDSRIIYAAGYFGDKGYVVKTQDGGKSWEEIYSEAQNQVSVRSIALNPNSPGQIVIGNSAGSLAYSGDSGNTWRQIKNFEDRINRVLWKNDQVYVLARTKGLFKSTNLTTGEFTELTRSLSESSSFLASFGSLGEKDFNQAYIVDQNIIYLTTGKGIFKTTDEGRNWQKLNLPGKQSSELPARAVAVARTSANVVYVSVGNVVYKSTNGGMTFQTQTVNTTGFVNFILVDPVLPQVAYAGNYVQQ